MTTLSPSASHAHLPEEFSHITARLDAVGSRFRLAMFATGLAKFLATILPLVLIAAGLAGAFPLAAWLNIAMLLLLLAIVALCYSRWLHHVIFFRPTYAQIARLIEENASSNGKAAELSLHNDLINAVLLAEELDTRTHPGWIPHVIREIAARTEPLPLEKSVPWRRVRKAWLWAGGILLAMIITFACNPALFAHGLSVLARPGAFVPHHGLVKIISVEPGNDSVVAGQSIDFTVLAETPDGKPAHAYVEITYASGKKSSLPMIVFGNDNTHYRRQDVPAAEDMNYVVTVGDSQSDRYHIAVTPQVHLAHLTLDAAPPAYTAREPLKVSLEAKDVTPARAAIETPVGSKLTLAASFDFACRQVSLDIDNGDSITLTPSADNKTFSTTLPIKDSLRYSIRLSDAQGKTLRTFPADLSDQPDPAARYTVTATPDIPPTITVTDPGKDIDAKPGQKLDLAASATDDYGLTQLTLEIAKGAEKEFRPLHSWPVAPKDGKPAHSAEVRWTLDFPASDYKLGDTLRYRFTATDNRDLREIDPTLAAQTTAGQTFTVTFNNAAAELAKTTKLWDELRKQLTVLLDKQVALKAQAAGFAPTIPTADMQKLAKSINAGQASLRADMAKLTQDFPFEPSMKLVQKSLQVLVVGDATSAVDRSNDILLLSSTKALPPVSLKLREHQARIIDVLQTLLAIAASEENRSAKITDKEGGDLPDDARQAWQKLAEELKQFEKEQKAVIDATADLAKKPKDQFDKADEKKVADLAAIEDKWEKFLNQRMVDMSKIAEQDQANASLLDEMVQMKVELAAAKDSLQTKATEVATPLEENGLESAKALDTHIERMLQQSPDRTKWQMEDAVTQNDPAMAELPQQLQDMVGDLMDKEEDLTDEMESTASKWADSLNKGAGWDAADGPISNMSAQGVTGNQLPKNMEIQGRSGEGREGRSSGEFVGAEAEGKGGRRTPTRMTDDPFSQGQVNDKSQESTGGATGGGKKGNFGGEGLEGQPPDELQNVTKRLQGAQAQLRNETERLSLQMRAAGYDNFKLVEADAFLKRADEALRQYNYHNALYYQEQAIQSMNTAKVLAGGQMHVAADTTPAVSDQTQRNIENALNGAMPKGYSDPVKAYFQKLANDQAPANP